MSFSYLQSNAAGGAPISVSYTNAINAGDLLICAVNSAGGAATPPTSTGETWVDSGLGSVNYNGGASSVAIFFVANCSAHAAGYVVTVNGNFSASIYEFSGQLTSGPKDTTNSNPNASSGAGSNNETANSITPAQAGELFFAFFATINGPLSAGTTSVTWSSPTGDVNGLAEYFIASGSSAVTANCTTGFGSGDAYCGAFISFKPAPASTSAPAQGLPPFFMG
jgi:hypothetical protein